MKRLIFAITALTLFIGAHAERHTINVGEFNELVVNDNINVIYSNEKDSVGLVTFELEKQYASLVMAERNKGKLKLQLDAEASTRLQTMPTIRVYSSYLSKAVNNNDSTLTLLSIAPGAKVDLQLSSNGKILAYGIDAVDCSLKIITGKGTIIASGRCSNLTINNVGTGIIQADEVDAKHVKCALMGTGTIGCAPSETLNVKGLGSGKIYYTGKPVITRNKLSNIKMIPLDNVSVDAPGTVTPDNAATEDANADADEAAEGTTTADETEEDGNSSLLNLMEVPETPSSSSTRKPVK